MLAEEFKNRKTYVWGLGLEGKSVLDWWRDNLNGQDIGIIENNIIPDDAQIVIKSPGVSIYLPEIQKAKQNGCRFTSLMNIFFSAIEKQQNKPTIIAITGTKGKSTTSSLLAFMLEKLGFNVALAGNIGISPLLLLDRNLDFIVLELSSFHVTDLIHDIDYGIIVNISQAHVDWHLSLENYINDKLRFTDIVKNLVVNAEDKNLQNLPDVSFYQDKNGFFVENSQVFFKDKKLDIPALQIKGDHNLANLCAVLSVLEKLDLPFETVLSQLGEFKALPHRLELVYQKNGLSFIDDSIATVPDSVVAGINAFDEDVAVIVGGFDNKPNFTELDEFLAGNDKVKVVLCLPDTGRLIKNAKSIQVDNMYQAVSLALENLKNGVVLLSPAAPSYNLYNNYKERGDDFAKIAKELL